MVRTFFTQDGNNKGTNCDGEVGGAFSKMYVVLAMSVANLGRSIMRWYVRVNIPNALLVKISPMGSHAVPR